MSEHNTYLGDSVYADLENGMIKLTTENGLVGDPRNVIYFDYDTLCNFFQYLFEKVPITRAIARVKLAAIAFTTLTDPEAELSEPKEEGEEG